MSIDWTKPIRIKDTLRPADVVGRDGPKRRISWRTIDPKGGPNFIRHAVVSQLGTLIELDGKPTTRLPHFVENDDAGIRNTIVLIVVGGMRSVRDPDRKVTSHEPIWATWNQKPMTRKAARRMAKSLEGEGHKTALATVPPFAHT